MLAMYAGAALATVLLLGVHWSLAASIFTSLTACFAVGGWLGIRSIRRKLKEGSS